MSAATAIGYVLVPLFGVFLCVAPMVSRPTIQFGVRVPPDHIEAAVIGRERRRYVWRSAVTAIVATGVVFAVGSSAPGWLRWIVLVLQLAADAGLFWWAHRRIARVKSAEAWFTGRRQTVVADTGWRTDPARFPVVWLLPAVAIVLATAVVGVLRYPDLPGHIAAGSGRAVVTTPARAFGTLIGQLFATGLWIILLTVANRFRPDLDTGDPGGSLNRHRRALGLVARAGLMLVACIDLTLGLAALRKWQIADPPTGLVLVPAALGVIVVMTAIVQAGRIRGQVGATASGTDRDDDRFWKAGLVYVNRDDPALMVNARFAFGYTPNLGNLRTWLILAVAVAALVALIATKLFVGW